MTSSVFILSTWKCLDVVNVHVRYVQFAIVEGTKNDVRYIQLAHMEFLEIFDDDVRSFPFASVDMLDIVSIDVRHVQFAIVVLMKPDVRYIQFAYVESFMIFPRLMPATFNLPSWKG